MDMKEPNALPQGQARGRGWLLMGVVLFVGLVIRVAALPSVGYVDDVREFAWAMLAMQYGLAGIYAHADPLTGHAINYPPMYTFVLFATASLYEALRVVDPEQRVLTTVLKLAATLADLGLCLVIYRMVCRWVSPKKAFVVAAIAAGRDAAVDVVNHANDGEMPQIKRITRRSKADEKWVLEEIRKGAATVSKEKHCGRKPGRHPRRDAKRVRHENAERHSDHRNADDRGFTVRSDGS